jgi:ABC-2 type transport system permease protein
VALYEIPYSDDFKASWIYYSSPLNHPGEILLGTVKAICVRLFLPAYLIISTFVLFIWGVRVIDDIIFGLLNNFLMVMILAMINKRSLPLSMPPNVRAQSGNLIRNILTFLLIALLGAFHFLLTQKRIFLMVAIPAQLITLYFMHRAYKRTTWDQITL